MINKLAKTDINRSSRFMVIKLEQTPSGAVCPSGKAPRRSGFTLIELLVVVLIIGILASVALPQYQKSVERARASEALTMLSALEKAVTLYGLENSFPYAKSSKNLKFYFLGNNAEENQALYVDLSALNCDSDEGTACASANFKYWALSTNARQFAGKSRPRGLGLCAERSGGEGVDYAFLIYFNEFGEIVSRDCVYETKFEQDICKGFESQGWESVAF